jgi:two-component system, OmpR family, sensor kinase
MVTGVEPRGPDLRSWIRRATSSIRVRALAWYLMIVATILAAGLWTIQQLLLARLTESIDSELTHEIDEITIVADSANIGPGSSPEAIAALLDTQVSRSLPDDGEVLVGLIGGEVVAAVPKPTGDAVVDSLRHDTWGPRPSAVPRHLTVQGVVYRWRATSVGDTGLWVVASPESTEQVEITEMLRTALGVSIGGLMIGAVIAWSTLGRMLMPLRRVNELAAEVSASDLSARVPQISNDEVGQLVMTINLMLDRVESAVANRLDFVDDLGHELRTPLTILRGQLEIFPHEPDQQQATIVLCLDELARMEREINGLLLLAKSRQPSFLRLQEIDLVELTDTALRRSEVANVSHRVVLSNVATGSLRCDPDRVLQATANLVANACAHAPIGSFVSLASHDDADSVRFVVSDEGPGIGTQDQARIFQRFNRGTGPSRSEGVGLGLAIVRAIAEAHGGTVGLDTTRTSGATVWFTISTKLASRGLVGS